MSETILEKAARAVWNPKALGLRDDEVETVWRNQSEEDRRVYFGIARAVLMAVREPDEEMCEAGNAADYGCTEGIELDRLLEGPAPDFDWQVGLGIVYTAMIDAILAQEEN